MIRKKRSYKRDTPIGLVRDHTLFAIACEGSVREPNYFRTFSFLSKKIAVDIIEDIVSEEEALAINSNKSAPKWVLDRAVRYIEKEGLNDEDQLWFVMDVDRWSEPQLREIANYCEKFKNWNIVLSNPCFEVWLYFHKRANINNSLSTNCKTFKAEISTFVDGGYHPLKFIPDLLTAIANAKEADRDKIHFFPPKKVTKVYKLGEAIIQIIGKRGLEDFLNITLPNLIEAETRKRVGAKKKRTVN